MAAYCVQKVYHSLKGFQRSSLPRLAGTAVLCRELFQRDFLVRRSDVQNP